MKTPLQEEGTTTLEDIKAHKEKISRVMNKMEESEGEKEASSTQVADLLAELRKTDIPANNAKRKTTITMTASLENLKVSIIV